MEALKDYLWDLNGLFDVIRGQREAMTQSRDIIVLMLTCTFENGTKASLRHTIVNVLPVKDGKLLLVKRAAHLTNPGKWALPGGFLDRDEILEQCVLRELHEETGYEGAIDKLLCIVDNPNRAQEDRQNVGFMYIVNVGEKTGKPDNESSEVAWFDLDRLPPEGEWAYDLYQITSHYIRYLKNPRPLPFFIHKSDD